MNIICIDTSAGMAVTAQGEKDPVTSILKPKGGQYSAHLIPLIDETVTKAGFTIDNTDIIVCPQGPGSFTGLRIAYAAAKAITLATNAQFYCIPTLQIIETGYPCAVEQTLAVIDAKRDRFYVQLFKEGNPAGQAQDICAKKAAGLLEADKKTVICGFGTKKFKNDMEGVPAPKYISFFETEHEKLSELMLNCTLAGKNLIKVHDYDGPVYIRKSDAEKGA